jgi:hypothetical protein
MFDSIRQLHKRPGVNEDRVVQKPCAAHGWLTKEKSAC